MTDNEIARKAWGMMGCYRLMFYAETGHWCALGRVLGEPVDGYGDSPREAMLDYIDMAGGEEVAATSREEEK